MDFPGGGVGRGRRGESVQVRDVARPQAEAGLGDSPVDRGYSGRRGRTHPASSLMRVELQMDEDASEYFHFPVMHFVAKPFVKNAATESAIRAMAWSASEAWAAVHNPAWSAPKVQ